MINKNDFVEVVSLSTPCSQKEIIFIKKFLEKNQLRAKINFEIETTILKNPDHEFATVSPKTRFLQLESAIKSASKIIWCARGGYGSAEVLPFLQQLPKPKKRKIFIGFSDISAISNFLIQNWEWEVISAPMLLQLALKKVSTTSEKMILDLIFGRKKELKYQLQAINGSKNHNINTQIVGGCLSVICAHFGTKNQLNWHNKILFLEDEGEDGERMDRYFHQIATIIFEKKMNPKAIVLGNFFAANIHGSPKAKNVEIAIKKFAQKVKDIPFFIDKEKVLGHSKNMMPIILGKEAQILHSKTLLQKVI